MIDSGIGITAEHLLHIFDLFVQLDTSLEHSVRGLGIGLTLVQQLIDLHGGSVVAQSEGLGRGSKFTVRLPLHPQTSVEQPPAVTAATSAAVFRRVLVVDDNQDSADSLATILSLKGYESRVVYDGLAALEAAAAFVPEVVLLDIGLPKLSGLDVCRRLREQPWGTDVVLVALTGWSQDEDRRRIKEAGFDSHLVKPVDIDSLFLLLASLHATRTKSSSQK